MLGFLAPLQAGIPPETLSLLLVVAGILLAAAEALAPGAHLVVLGVALLVAGLIGLLLGPLASPIVLAGLVLVFGGLTLYGYRRFDIYGGKGTGQTSDSDSLKGKTGRVTSRVSPTEGEIKLAGGGFNPYYAARSVHGEIPEGEEVVVVDPGGGNVLTVESLGPSEDEIDRELRRERARSNRETDETRSTGEKRDGDSEVDTETERA